MTFPVILRAIAVAMFLTAIFVFIRAIAADVNFKLGMALSIWVGLSFGLAGMHRVIYRYVVTGEWQGP